MARSAYPLPLFIGIDKKIPGWYNKEMNIEVLEDQKIKIRSPRDLFPIMREILLRDNEYDRNKEHFWAVALANNSMLQYVELISLGTLYQSVVEPMDVFSWALHKQVAMLILVHNHPSGELKPTHADLDLTDNLIQVGRVVRIPVVEHLIITTEGYYSFDDGGDIKRLNLSKKYVPGYLEIERIQKEAQRIGEELGRKAGLKEGKKEGKREGKKEGLKEGEKKGVEKGIKEGKKEGLKEGEKKGLKDGKIDMAKMLKVNGVDASLIAKSSGLSKEEIENL